MDVIIQFYAEVRIHQMLSFLTYSHANNFDNIPFIDKNMLIYTALANLIPNKAKKSVERVVKFICLHYLKGIKDNVTPKTVEGIKKYCMYFNDFLDSVGSLDDKQKRSLVSEICNGMAEIKKKKIIIPEKNENSEKSGDNVDKENSNDPKEVAGILENGSAEGNNGNNQNSNDQKEAAGDGDLEQSDEERDAKRLRLENHDDSVKNKESKQPHSTNSTPLIVKLQPSEKIKDPQMDIEQVVITPEDGK